MSNVGEQLKQAREAQRKSRADVAGETGILIHHLAALEYGNFDALPDDQTVAGFVKTYAEYLGFRPEEPVAEFWAERGVEPAAVGAPAVEAAEPESAPPGKRRKPWGWMIAGTAAVVLVVLWFAMRGDPEPQRVAAEPAAPPSLESTSDEPETPAGEPEPAAPEPAPPEPAATAAATTLRVPAYGVGSGVRDRGLIEETDRFKTGQRVWFWTHVSGGGGGDRLRHVWLHEGREISAVELDIGNASWRTWSVKTMFDGSAGRWAVEARDASGRVLARSEFVCEP